MQVTRLDKGVDAPETADRIRVTKIAESRFRWGGSVQWSKSAVFNEPMIDYPTLESAEGAACDWAAHHGVEHLYIENFDA